MAPAGRINVAFDDGNSVEMSIDEFREANELFPEMVEAACEALSRGETYRGGGGASPAFTISRIEQRELPEISELVDAIRDAVKAADAFNIAHPELEFPDSAAGQDWKSAFERLRQALSVCDKALEAHF